MSLIITFVLEPAKRQMNCANANGTRTLRSSVGGRTVSVRSSRVVS